MAVAEHEEMLWVFEQPLLVDIAMVIAVETLGDRLDQAADDVLQGVSAGAKIPQQRPGSPVAPE
jgi:hypothetical protein